MAKLNKFVSNGIEYEVQDYELNDSLSKVNGILKSSKGSLETAKAGTDYDYPVITGDGAPSTLTIAIGVGQRYVDLTATSENGRVPEYVCTAITGSSYTWAATGVTKNSIPSVEGYVVSNIAPESTTALWIDSSNDGVLKYFNETSNTWEPVNTVWG